MQSIHVIDEAINCIRQQMLYSVTRILWLAFCGSWRVCWVFELGELGVAVVAGHYEGQSRGIMKVSRGAL